MLPPFAAAHPHILIQVISLAFLNWFVRYFEHQRGLHGDSTGQGEETNVEANNNRGGRGAGRPVRHKIPLVILIFLVFRLKGDHFTCTVGLHWRPIFWDNDIKNGNRMNCEERLDLVGNIVVLNWFVSSFKDQIKGNSWNYMKLSFNWFV